MPRGGPAPTPSRFTPRSGAVSLGSGGGGPGRWVAARSTGRSVAAAALLRTSLARERSLRRREHESLLGLLRRENVVVVNHRHRP
ncbi:unnamed protein product, partial [Ectocarpus sp. 12 AP-2014]